MSRNFLRKVLIFFSFPLAPNSQILPFFPRPLNQRLPGKKKEKIRVQVHTHGDECGGLIKRELLLLVFWDQTSFLQIPPLLHILPFPSKNRTVSCCTPDCKFGFFYRMRKEEGVGVRWCCCSSSFSFSSFVPIRLVFPRVHFSPPPFFSHLGTGIH